MDGISKFVSDIEKIKKHDRADNNGNYDGERACKSIADLFISNNKYVQNLASSYADYWMQTYIYNSTDIKNEPSDTSLDKIIAMEALLENSSEDTACLTKEDYNELCSLTNMEAEDLPLDLLNDLMTIFVDKQAF